MNETAPTNHASAEKPLSHAPKARFLSAASVVLSVLGGATLALPPALCFAQTSPEEYVGPGIGEDGQPQLRTRWRLDEENPASSLPTLEERDRNPLEFGYFLQELTFRADTARTEGDWDRAARFYEAIASVVPENAVGFSMLCESYEHLGRVADGISACADALSRGGVRLEDFVRYARLALASGAPALEDQRLDDLRAVIEHLVSQDDASARLSGWAARCELNLRRRDLIALRACVAQLQTLAPESPGAISNEWGLAMLEHRLEDAERLMNQASDVGVPPETLAQMREAMALARQEPARQEPEPSQVAAASVSEEQAPTPIALWVGVAAALAGLAFLIVRRARAGRPDAA